MTSAGKYVFQKDWTSRGSRGLRDFMLMPAIYFGAVSPGLFVTSALTGYLPGLWLAIAITMAGYGATHMLYLGRMDRFWRAMINIRGSWISRGFWLNAGFTATGLLYAAVASGIVDAQGAAPALRAAAIAFAIGFALYPGFLFSSVKAIPFWRSWVEPVVFLLQGMMGGAALQVIMLALTGAEMETITLLVKANYMMLLAVFVLLMYALLSKAVKGEAARASVGYLIAGDFSARFVWGAVGLGMVVPLGIISIALIAGAGGSAGLFAIAMGLELAGIYIAKTGIIQAGAYTAME